MQGLTSTLVSKLPGPTALYAVQDVPRELRRSGWFTDATQFRPQGSELIVQNINHKLVGGAVLNEPSVEQLKASRVRSIVFVADYMGSGGEFERYFEFFWRNKTLRSWHSLGLIRFHLIVYGISRRARARLARDTRVTLDAFQEAGLDLEAAPWSPSELNRVRQVCVAYAADRKRALGWMGSEGLVIFGHTLPNNLPHVLYQRVPPRHLKTWIPLVPADRQLGLDVGEAVLQSGQRPVTDAATSIDKVAGRAGGVRVRLVGFSDRLALVSLASTYEYPLILLLAALRAGIRDDVDLMTVCNMQHSRLIVIESIAKRIGYVSDRGSVTRLGRLFLFRHARKVKRISKVKSVPDSPYYPQQLR